MCLHIESYAHLVHANLDALSHIKLIEKSYYQNTLQDELG